MTIAMPCVRNSVRVESMSSRESVEINSSKTKRPLHIHAPGPLGNTLQVAVVSQTITVRRKVDKANVYSP
jgi:hypothetical protein